MPDPVLTARGISKHFGGLTAVDDVDFAVSAGEVVALLGDDGAGKSTLIKCISGVYRPETGQVSFKGADITGHAPADIRQRGIETIYQDLALAVPEQRKVLSLIRSLRESGIPVILISHTLHDVMAVADRLVIMRRGQVVPNIPRAEASEELVVRHIVGAA